jgi:CheY-like chemotaxis protein
VENGESRSPVRVDGSSLRILVAEDNPVNGKFVSLLLEKSGHRVSVADNGKDALELLEQGVFDVVLMDIQMPVVNGEEALVRIREKDAKRGTHLPVLALTAYALKGDREKFLRQGFDGYLSKPVEAEVLLEEIMRVTNTAIVQ